MGVSDNVAEGPTAELQLDLLGEPCPYPVMQTLDVLERLASGTVIEVVTDCPQASVSVPEEVSRAGHELVGLPVSRGPESLFVIRAK